MNMLVGGKAPATGGRTNMPSVTLPSALHAGAHTPTSHRLQQPCEPLGPEEFSWAMKRDRRGEVRGSVKKKLMSDEIRNEERQEKMEAV